jgi:uncharacterized membrane protein YdbT with pleckstrin-like domain
MAFPRKLLIPGEDIVLELRPHWVALAIPALVALAAVAFGGWLIATADGLTQTIVVLAMLVVLVVYPLRRLLWWVTSLFVVTTSRVIHREGFLAKRSMEIPLDKINDVRFEQKIFERIMGAGTLIIQSASETGRNEFTFIRHPEEVQRTIYHSGETARDRQVQRSVGQMSQGAPAPVTTPAGAAPGGAPNITTELERLGELRAKGVLTEEEFQAQKARILEGS